jgi:hypothetical protein
MHTRIIAIGCLTGIPLLIAALLLVGPEVDNYVNVLNAINLSAAKDYRVHSQRLEELIAKKYGVISWDSYHPDTLYTSNVDCHARDHHGNQVVLAWEVGRFISNSTRAGECFTSLL